MTSRSKSPQSGTNRTSNRASKPSAKVASAAAQREQLSRHICDAILPGDVPMDEQALTETTRFMLEAAAQREPSRSALLIEPASEVHRFQRIAIINDDMPFLVDSIAAAITELGLTIERLVHPIIPVRRTAKGKLTHLGAERDPADTRESMIYIETERADAAQLRDLEKSLRITLGDVRAAVDDWPKTQSAMNMDAARISNREDAALLQWFSDGMLTQLGHLTRKRDGSHANLNGICRKSSRQLLADASYDRAFAWFDTPGEDEQDKELLVVKANRIAQVHRRVPLDLFIVPVRTNGRVEALSVHAGVWTSAALASPPNTVPRLRTALDGLTDELGFDRGGHAGKALVHALTVLPHDLLIGFEAQDIARVATIMMGLIDRPRPRLAAVEAPLARHLFGFVWLPRDLLSTQTRTQIQELLTSTSGAQLLDWSLQVEGGNLALMRFVLDIREAEALPTEAELDARLQDMLRGWGEAVERQLCESEEPARAAALTKHYAAAFPQSYRSNDGPSEAAKDIVRLDAIFADQAHVRGVRLYRHDGDPADQLRLKVYQQEGDLPLSDAVPALENFGFTVLTETPTVLSNGDLGTIHDFVVGLPDEGAAKPVLTRVDAVEDAIAAVLTGHAENDAFNRLVVEAALTARETDWLRAFYRYLRQAGMGFTIYTVVDALSAAADVTRAILDLFSARHDPEFAGNREQAGKTASDAIRRGLGKVTAINDDRLLRLYRSLIEAILRTNVFAPAAQEALAFKIDSSLVPNLPKPIPWREIFVYSRRVEGIHLRAGPIARGGLRWSDRRDDFRTEILGLMKAQRVKNAVIVPTGAKGGFYPKQLPSPSKDREGWAAEGQASYEVFIRTLLSITDNIVDGKVVHPGSVVITDGEDPYFVVAADKGTARFSDVANAIAQRANFWLDDAFASGGSNGYDHKAMGITARGGWVSVQRHFLEMGVDVQSDPVRVVGCGDMSGDVFGNGMLLSKALKLVAAFDHRHIFIDPDPDPAKSWAERKRLFDLPRSSWEDYDSKLISKGGGVFARDAKQIKLSKPARQALGIDAKELEPEELMRAIVSANVDLIWFGGIGTYIKGEAENNAAVGDPANDALRINAKDVRAKVIGEGANLGVTQAGRIEFSLNSGRINTDFIDNSAGVDCSDNEVNIKIALAAARAAGQISAKKRNTLLADMTDEVAAIVLENNRLQALALSVAETGGARAMASQLHLIEKLEDRGALDRQTEGLADSQALTRRAADGAGLTRPELAVLLSSTKLVLQDAIEASPLADAATLEPLLFASFPTPMRGKFKKHISGHRLRREIVATKLANRMINRLGIIHPFELAEEEGVDLATIAAAFVAVEAMFDLDALWAEIDTAEMPEQPRLRLFDRLAAAIANLMSDLMRTTAGHIDTAALVADLGKDVRTLSKASDTLLGDQSRQQSAQLCCDLVEAGAPAQLSRKVSHMFDLDGAIGLSRLASDTKIDPRSLTMAFTQVGETLGLDWAQSVAALMNPSDIWERPLVSGLARDFQQMRLDFLRRLLRRKAGKDDPAAAVSHWASDNQDSVDQFRSMIARARNHTPVGPVMLAQIASQARNLLER